MAILPTNRNDQYKLLVGIVFLALAGLYWNFLWAPQNVALATMQEHVDSLASMNQRARVDVALGSIEKLRAEAVEDSIEVEIMRQLVPTSNEVPALLNGVSSAARQAGLELSDFGPAGVVEGDQFDTYKYKLGVTGPYHRIADFLTNVGKLRRIVAPINVTLALAGQNSQDKNRDKATRLLDAKFEIQTYVAHVSAAPVPSKVKP
jgi:type IV pilus assembly protein PilO